MRRPLFATTASAELATSMLDICQWADRLGFDLVYFGEHHAADDGYLLSPLVASAAAAGRTSRMRLRPILLVLLYHPLRLAEDIAMVVLLSERADDSGFRGRIPAGGVRNVRRCAAGPAPSG
ncbi:LLM class flavin-dependent oxidoreductase [uncultured Mycobacterium sp.]|uniref:LLM class flavin-dependent oxidoreductase n=1 Tax=uncultured Mycobacterium sp. TaxID=171292 RepID=UPI0035C9E913